MGLGSGSGRFAPDPRSLPQLPRDLKGAREAWEKRDVDASKQAHRRDGPQTRRGTDLLLQRGLPPPEHLAVYFGEHEEPHISASGESVKALIFGGLDGVVTIFAIVAGCVGAKITPAQVIVVGIGNLLADAFSMGFGEYVSSTAEDEYIEAERLREQWEIDNCPEGEKGEMIDIYQSKYGFKYEDAATVIEIAFKYPKFFLSHMMIEELGLKIEDAELGTSPLKRGVMMFLSFGAFGLVPLIGFSAYLILAQRNATTGGDPVHEAFLVTCALTLLTLFILGVFKARFSNENRFKSGCVMMLNGAVASAAAYGSGAFLQELIHKFTSLNVLAESVPF